ncbi:hypothetical protein [Pedobacter jeongneungensis]|uniref:hypothetical protein n=1 Tax=Pedobacter jeongneungensis TaxID=947309 RepID=UPI00046A877A|nr:hypothetical protein [Pedobacter jeongneungensis]
MFVLQGYFEIGVYKFRVINNIEITRSVDEITDTAVIKMPTKFLIKEGSGKAVYVEEAIKKGDPVKIVLGYKDKLERVEFTGYVDRIKCTTPIEIYCEDATWLLKRKAASFSESKTTLKKVLESIVSGTALKLAANIPEMALNKYLIKDKNGAQALKQIKDEFKEIYKIYLNDEGELYCGLQELNNINQKASYDLNYNIIENKLEFKSGDDRKVKIICEGCTRDNKKITATRGDKDGEEFKFNSKVVTDQQSIDKLADEYLKIAKYGGYSGDVTSFLLPVAAPAMAVEIFDKKHANREGKYFIKKVVTTYGMGGARRIVSIGNKLTTNKK